jgi:hypothetical protein
MSTKNLAESLEILVEQDVQLERASNIVDEIAKRAEAIDVELGHQRGLLRHMETRMDGVEVAQNSNTRRLDAMVERAGGPRPFCVIVLLLVAIGVLLFLIVYT